MKVQWQVTQAIKDTFPYFLGAVDERQFLKQHLLDTAQDELRRLETQLAQESLSRNALASRVRGLVSEAKRAGLIEEGFEPIDPDVAIARLDAVSQIAAGATGYIPDFGDTIERIRNEQNTLADRLEDTKQEIRATRLFLSDQGGFVRESAEQLSRLKSLNLYKPSTTTGHLCPICSSEPQVPTPQLAQLRQSLSSLEQEFTSVQRENPHVQQRIDELETRRIALEADLRENQATLARVITEDERARAQYDLATSRARTIGRIAAYLESFRPDTTKTNYEVLINTARERVRLLEEDLHLEEVSQRMDTFLNMVSKKMSELSNSLDLEHGGSALRLDIRNLTVVADTDDGPIPLTRMGSGENWVGYHILVHLALHWWFRSKGRPVPEFLILDQPSQAHYPPEKDEEGSLDPLSDEDRKAVRDLFALMHRFVTETSQTSQIIVLDHAHIDEEWFEQSIIEEWRHGRALIPNDWGSAS